MSTLHSLTISPSAPDLDNGARQQFTLTGTGADNSPVTVPVDAARWTVDQPSLGTVDQDGLFTAAPAGAGVGQVTAAAGGRQAMASIGVSELTKTLAPLDNAADWSLQNNTGRRGDQRRYRAQRAGSVVPAGAPALTAPALTAPELTAAPPCASRSAMAPWPDAGWAR